MNINKSKIGLALGGLLFLSAPFASALADDKHSEIKMVQQDSTMKSIESELRSYVKAFKMNDSQKMQQHINKLLQLSEKATKEIPAKIVSMHATGKMDHSNMDMTDMDHSKMTHSEMIADMDDSEMTHSEMIADMDDSEMTHSEMIADMDHAKMTHSEMIADMDDSEMTHSEMIADMDHSKMDMKDMPEMDHGDIKMDSADHDMSAMPSMKGMTSEQHHQHMMYMQGSEELHGSFQQLAKTQDKSEIKAILGEVKTIIKNNQLFR